MSSVIRRKREARGATLFLWIKLLAMTGFFATVFLLGANPFTGDLGGERGAETPAAVAE
ncbi:MAG: hypothetical protein AAF577_17595 [Pseudomonadota bacterium]